MTDGPRPRSGGSQRGPQPDPVRRPAPGVADLRERLLSGFGSPEGVVYAGAGTGYQDIDPAGSGKHWRKTTPAGNTGWQELGGGGLTASLTWTPLRMNDTHITTGPRDTAEWAVLGDLLLLRGTVLIDSGWPYSQTISWVDIDLTPYQADGERIDSGVNVNARSGPDQFKQGVVFMGNRGGASIAGWNNKLEMVLRYDGGGPTPGGGLTLFFDSHIRLHGDS